MQKKFAKSALSEKRVLDAAAKIFRDHGYAGTTMRIIADEANMKAGSIYYHFGSKDQLLSAVLDQGITILIDSVKSALDELPEDASGRRRIEVAIYSHLATIIGIGDYTLASRRVLGQIPEEIREQNLKLRGSYVAIWHQILNEARKSGEIKSDTDLTLARLFILGALNWSAEWFEASGRSLVDVARSFSGLVLDGLIGSDPVTEAGARTKSSIKNKLVGPDL